MSTDELGELAVVTGEILTTASQVDVTVVRAEQYLTPAPTISLHVRSVVGRERLSRALGVSEHWETSYFGSFKDPLVAMESTLPIITNGTETRGIQILIWGPFERGQR